MFKELIYVSVFILSNIAQLYIHVESAVSHICRALIEDPVRHNRFRVEVVNFVYADLLADPWEERCWFVSIVMNLIWIYKHVDINIKFCDGSRESEVTVVNTVSLRECHCDIADPGGNDGNPFFVEEGRSKELGDFFRRYGKRSNH